LRTRDAGVEQERGQRKHAERTGNPCRHSSASAELAHGGEQTIRSVSGVVNARLAGSGRSRALQGPETGNENVRPSGPEPIAHAIFAYQNAKAGYGHDPPGT
jgi:hypothetical protein